jgi:hypothetical protein
VLFPEPSNPHDSNAIAVLMAGGCVGHVPRDLAATLQRPVMALEARHGRMVGCPVRVDPRGPSMTLLLDVGQLGIGPKGSAARLETSPLA